ncbi:hypothetical protein A3K73_02580 [Candidatus Pacearchaeota archaeon RBG_13_36_9]|nr:MAG: hypothetical protein A3K73_02580 [Candidatus Pacearchaeota archaeon RBG_13_36_9]
MDKRQNSQEIRAAKRKEARHYESLASSETDSYRSGRDCMQAAKSWRRAGDYNRALKDYKKAALYFDQAPEETREDMEAGNATVKDFYFTTKIASKAALKARRNAERLEKVKKREWRGLAGKVSAVATILGLVGSLFFFSSNLTGNVIGLNQTSSNVIGAILLSIGIVGAFFYFVRRRQPN